MMMILFKKKKMGTGLRKFYTHACNLIEIISVLKADEIKSGTKKQSFKVY